MNPRVRVSPQAARQIRAAADWWLRNRDKAPDAFADEIERAFNTIRSLPAAGEPVAHSSVDGVRRVLLGRVHYHVYYRAWPNDDVVDVLAVWHASRGTPPAL